MHQFVSWRRARRTGFAVLTALLATLWCVTPASAQTMRRYKLSEMVAKSENIFIGQCVKKETLVRDGSIVSRYTLAPREILKGKSASTNQLVVEELGGELTDGPLPVGQHVTGMADLKPGEEVLLFTAPPQRNPKVQAAIAELERKAKAQGRQVKRARLDPAALRIVGLNQGHYSVLLEPASGKRMVAPGATTREFLAKQAIEDRTTSGPIKLASNSVASKYAEPGASRRLSEQAAAADEIMPYESLDQVKLRIASLVQKK